MTDGFWAKGRLYIDGRLVDEETVSDPEEVEPVADRHAQIAAEAEDRGLRHMIEIEFMDGEHVRFGSDARGMVDPILVGDAVDLEWAFRRLRDLRDHS